MSPVRPHYYFEQGYLAACAGQPRQLLAEVPALYRAEWLQGYDDAEADDAATRAWMVEGFGMGLAA